MCFLDPRPLLDTSGILILSQEEHQLQQGRVQAQMLIRSPMNISHLEGAQCLLKG